MTDSLDIVGNERNAGDAVTFIKTLERSRRRFLATGDIPELSKLLELAKNLPSRTSAEMRKRDRLIYATEQNIAFLSRRAATAAGERWRPSAAVPYPARSALSPAITSRDKPEKTASLPVHLKGIRKKMCESAAPYLKPGETVQVVFGGQTRSPNLAIALMLLAVLPGGILFMLLNRFCIFVVSDSRILVLKAGKVAWTQARARGVLTELSRSTRLGPPSGWFHTIEVDGRKIRVNEKYFKDILTADQALETRA
jgi:hypothetical protein